MNETIAAKPQAPVVVSAESLKVFAVDLFRRAGLPPGRAETVADVLVWANLRGIDTHGINRIPRYIEFIDQGAANPDPDIRVVSETVASVLIDAGKAFGPIAMTEAMAAAVRKAREAGVGLAVVRATTHTAALGYYTLSAAREGMAAIAMAASWPNMVYHGTRAAGVSTSPISIAVPGGDRGPLLFDMATSVVSMGKLVQARKTGQPLEPGWAIDKAGNPTTDPAAASVPLPMGGPKGSGLALMVECLTSLLGSTPIVADFLEGLPEGLRHRQAGLAIAIDLARFCDPAAFRREVDRLVRIVKALPRADEDVEVLVPGERSERTQKKRTREGIPIPRPILDELNAVAARLGAPALSEHAR